MLISEHITQHMQVFIIKPQYFQDMFPYSMLFLEVMERDKAEITVEYTQKKVSSKRNISPFYFLK